MTSVALADSGDPRVSAARGEGDPITLGERNPGSGESTRETAIVANAGDGGLVLRPSNTAKGGRAISATCDNDGLTDEDGCVVYVNEGRGAAATFRTQGSVPYSVRSMEQQEHRRRVARPRREGEWDLPGRQPEGPQHEGPDGDADRQHLQGELQGRDSDEQGAIVFDVPDAALGKKLELRVNELGVGSTHGFIRLATK